MNNSQPFLRQCIRTSFAQKPSTPPLFHPRAQWRLECQRVMSRSQKRHYANPADHANFRSVVDDPPRLVRVGKQNRHGYGLILLALMPLTAFALGTWQVRRLTWKTDLIAKFEDRLTREPLPLPPQIDPSAIGDFDYRRVYTPGTFRHDQEMLVGPRIMEGENGFNVITPLERPNGASTILVSRGWIPKKFRDQATRPEGLPQGEVRVEGLLREPFKKNMFTPDNNLEKHEFYFPDIKQMAEVSGSTATWVEETMENGLMEILRRQEKGIPVARAPEVDLRNNHAQYIFTWYALGLVTSVMLWMVVKKKPSSITQRVTRNREW